MSKCAFCAEATAPYDLVDDCFCWTCWELVVMLDAIKREGLFDELYSVMTDKQKQWLARCTKRYRSVAA